LVGEWAREAGRRVIYFLVRDGAIWLLIAYTKAKFDDLPVEFLARLKRSIEDG